MEGFQLQLLRPTTNSDNHQRKLWLSKATLIPRPPAPTPTPQPPAATNTPVPTNRPTQPPPTATSTPTQPAPSPTNTTLPPSSTPTNTPPPPTATNTPIPPPPTNTPTSVPPSACTPFSNGVILEAENAERNGGIWEIRNDPAASGGQYVIFPNENGEGTASSPHYLDFCISFPTSGTYSLLGRSRGPNDADNSLFWQIDGGVANVWHIDISAQYVTHPLEARFFSAGEHTIRIILREGGSRIDALQINSGETGWQVVETFNSLATGGIDNIKGWQSTGNVAIAFDPASSGNEVLAVNGDDNWAYKALPASVTNSNTGTLFFRMRRDGVANAFGGLSDVPGPTQFDDYEAQAGVQDVGPSELKIRSGGGFLSAGSGTYLEDVWYCVWLVVDNSANTYEAYIQGGQYTDQAQVFAGGTELFSLRNGGSTSMTTFFSRLRSAPYRHILSRRYLYRSGWN